jgi:hypothetical protein
MLCLAGCQSSPPVAPAEAKAPTAAERAAEEAQSVAVTSLGKQAEVLAHGDLAQNGMEQVLAVDRMSSGAPGNQGGVETASVLVTRAAVLERNAGKWFQVLLCDEHLKNPRGYLGGNVSPAVNGWRLEYRQDPAAGLVMKFTSAASMGINKARAGEHSEPKNASFDVRWNKNAKRYQSFDQSHERYLSEIPTLEPTESILK